MTEKLRGYISENLTVVKHGSLVNRVLGVDDDFGQRKGSVRNIEFPLEPRIANQWHVHSGMSEIFTPIDGTVSVSFIAGADDADPIIETHRVEPGQSLVVEENTPHLIINNTEENSNTSATQTITKLGGKTITFNLK